VTLPGGPRVPAAGGDAEDEAVPDLGDDLDRGRAADQAPERLAVPRDHALAVDDFGTTAYEEEHGESLDGRLAREEPDALTDDGSEPADGDDEVGRLVESDEGARPDTEAELTARSAGTDRGGFSAEESAMHLDPDS